MYWMKNQQQRSVVLQIKYVLWGSPPTDTVKYRIQNRKNSILKGIRSHKWRSKSNMT